MLDEAAIAELTKTREEIAAALMKPEGQRSASSARGVHHTALISSDVRRTVHFYQDLWVSR